jgi:hypothetical protein
VRHFATTMTASQLPRRPRQIFVIGFSFRKRRHLSLLCDVTVIEAAFDTLPLLLHAYSSDPRFALLSRPPSTTRSSYYYRIDIKATTTETITCACGLSILHASSNAWMESLHQCCDDSRRALRQPEASSEMAVA